MRNKFLLFFTIIQICVHLVRLPHKSYSGVHAKKCDLCYHIWALAMNNRMKDFHILLTLDESLLGPCKMELYIKGHEGACKELKENSRQNYKIKFLQKYELVPEMHQYYEKAKDKNYMQECYDEFLEELINTVLPKTGMDGKELFEFWHNKSEQSAHSWEVGSDDFPYAILSWPEEEQYHQLWRYFTWPLLNYGLLSTFFNIFLQWLYACHLERRIGSNFIALIYFVTAFSVYIIHHGFKSVNNGSGAFTGAIQAIWLMEILPIPFLKLHQDWTYLRDSKFVKISKMWALLLCWIIYYYSNVYLYNSGFVWRFELSGMLIGFVFWSTTIFIGGRSNRFNLFNLHRLNRRIFWIKLWIHRHLFHRLRSIWRKMKIIFSIRNMGQKQIPKKASIKSSDESVGIGIDEAAIEMAEEKVAHLLEEVKLLQEEKGILLDDRRKLKSLFKVGRPNIYLSEDENARIENKKIDELTKNIKEIEEELKIKEDTVHSMQRMLASAEMKPKRAKK